MSQWNDSLFAPNKLSKAIRAIPQVLLTLAMVFHVPAYAQTNRATSGNAGQKDASATALRAAQQRLDSLKKRYGGRDARTLDAAQALGAVHLSQGRPLEAYAHFKQALEIRNDLDGVPNFFARTTLIQSMIDILVTQDRLGEFASFGVPDKTTVFTLRQLADKYSDANRSDVALALLRRGIALTEAKTIEGFESAGSWNALGVVQLRYKHHAEARASFARAVELAELQFGDRHVTTIKMKHWFASALMASNLLKESIVAYSQVLNDLERQPSDGDNSGEIARARRSLVVQLIRAGRYVEAEPHAHRSLVEAEVTDDKQQIIRCLDSIGTIFRELGRYSESNIRLSRARELAQQLVDAADDEKGKSAATAELARRATYIGILRYAEGNFLGAIESYREARRLFEDAGPSALASELMSADINIGASLVGLGDDEQGEALLQRVYAQLQEQGEARGLQAAGTLRALALLRARQHRFQEALALLEQAREIRASQLPVGHPSILHIENYMGEVKIASGHLLEASQLFEVSTAQYDGRRDRLEWATRVAVGQIGAGITTADRTALEGYVRALIQLAATPSDASAEFLAKAFWAAQSVLKSSVGVAISQSTARNGIQDEKLARKVRELQDYLSSGREQGERLALALSRKTGNSELGVSERVLSSMIDDLRERAADWNGGLDQKLIDLRAPRPTEGQIEATVRAEIVDRVILRHDEKKQRSVVSDATEKADALLAELQREFPSFVDLINPRALSIEEVQAMLQPNEALLFVLIIPKGRLLDGKAIAWAVTKSAARAAVLDLDTTAISDTVAALRCGLEPALWQSAGAPGCRKLLARQPFTELVGRERVSVLPFDASRAHALYAALIGPFKDILAEKELLYVPSGPLTSLPLNILVKEPPAAAFPESLSEYRRLAWLGVSQPITVVPSISSLRALRSRRPLVKPTKPYLGVGNPILEGDQKDTRYSAYNQRLAARAASLRTCANLVRSEVTASATDFRGRQFAPISRGGDADIEAIRSWPPLPETAEEVCEVGRRLGADDVDVLLGARATEGTLKALSRADRLAEYGVVHFATHGAIGGQVRGTAEPGLILTPPDKLKSSLASLGEDDGFLSASEIATLKFNADWIVLSACNTAGAEGESGEALSGIARAFFYAGAKTLLVSHWEVESQVAVKLSTYAFGEFVQNPYLGRAEAFRRAMRDAALNGRLSDAHPSQWAPFAVVGYGGSAR